MVEKGEDASFSWYVLHFTGMIPSLTSMSVYSEGEDDKQKIWTNFGGIQKKGQEMFNGRLNVNYFDVKEPTLATAPMEFPYPVASTDGFFSKKLTVTIENVNFNDAITIVLSNYQSNGGPVVKSSVTLDVQGNFGTIPCNFHSTTNHFLLYRKMFASWFTSTAVERTNSIQFLYIGYALHYEK